MRAIDRFAGLSVLALLAALPAQAATVTVTLLTDGNAGSPAGAGSGQPGDLRNAIVNANADDVIVFSCASAPCTVNLSGPLPPITRNLTIDGGARGRIVIDGANTYRAFYADTGTITLRNLKVQNVQAKGGNGGGAAYDGGPGGGGAGLGAGLFVAAGATVTVSWVDFVNVAAVGGTGGSAGFGPTTAGGGGGMGGGATSNGGASFGIGNGNGGGGILGPGSNSNTNAAGNGGLGGGGGGGARNPNPSNGAGGSGYGNGAAGSAGVNADASATPAITGHGGAGGFGGGGGGAPSTAGDGSTPGGASQTAGQGVGGAGGFGGGGGGGDTTGAGGAGGPGGGGGSGGAGGTGGELMAGLSGGDASGAHGGGGGGAAAGAGIFVYQGSVTVETSTIDGVTVVAGNPGGNTNLSPNGAAGGTDATPVFSYNGAVNGATSLGPVAGVLAAPIQGMTVTRAGAGTGTVTSSVGGLSCPGTCSTTIATFTDITLTAAPDAGSVFAGWSGNCEGTAAAFTVTRISAATACTATFSLPAPPPTPSNPGPAPLPSFVAAPVPPVIDVAAGANGAGSVSLASSFPNPGALSFTVGTAGGGALPSWLTFDPATATFNFQVPPMGSPPFADKAVDVRTAGSNTIYPPVLRTANIPVVVSATGNGQTYTVPVEMSFFYPRNPGVIAAASLSIDGAAGNGASGRSSQSYDGGQVVFETAATNLFPGSANSFTDILRYHGLSGMRDRLSQTAIPGGGVANAADGASVSPAVSADGRWAAFASDAPGITLTPTAKARQVYRASLVYPRVPLNEAATPAPVPVSATSAGIVGNALSDNPAISQDGRYVAFDSVATNFAAGLDATRRVWRKDMVTGDLVQVAAGRYPSISWDGNWIAFEADGAVQLKNMTTGTSQAIGSGTAPRLSARGDRLVYVNGGKVMLGSQAIADGDQPGISADGRFVVHRNGAQVWVRDIDRGVAALVSQTAAGTGATGDSANPSISGDGSTIAFTSTARDLVGGNPGAGQLYLVANPLPLPDRTGYWYQANAANGQGWVMERWGTQTYVGGLVYDGDGRATWMTGFCTLQGLTCQGTLSGWTGGTAFGAAGPAAPVPAAGPGFTVTTDGRNATLTVGSGSFALSPFPIGGTSTTAYAGVPQAGWWYEPAAGNSGNGYFLAVNTQTGVSGAVQQVAYLSVLSFDTQGRAVWYAAQGVLAPNLSATLFQYSGGAVVSGTAVGQVRLTFDGTKQAILNLPNGRNAVLARWRF